MLVLSRAAIRPGHWIGPASPCRLRRRGGQPILPQHQVPGVPLAAWSGPDGSSLVLFRTLPSPGGSRENDRRGRRQPARESAGLTLVVHRTETVGDIPRRGSKSSRRAPAMPWPPADPAFRPSPPGKSLLPTREVTIGIHRPEATLFLTWNIPESSYAASRPRDRDHPRSVRFTTSGHSVI